MTFSTILIILLIAFAFILLAFIKRIKKFTHENSLNADKSLREYSIHIELNPNDANAYIERGNIKRRTGDFIGAIEDFNKALKIFPGDAVTYYSRGIARSNFNDFKGAAEDFTKAIELGLNDTRIYYQRGFAKEKDRNFRGAIEDYNIYLSSNPRDAEAYYNRGNSKLQLGNMSDGYYDLKKAGDLGFAGAGELMLKYKIS
jgi:tetratricopeptide (TPR) repeat protein